MSKDSLGDRMKAHYEDRTRYFLPRRTYTIIRVDGQAFHTLTNKAEKPFDEEFIVAMRKVGERLSGIQGAKLAYTQSDECSVLLTDFDDIKTEAWFDGNIQKICSSAAAIATQQFNLYMGKSGKFGYGTFDARVFTIPDRDEVINYFLWRQKDWIRNSVQMLARSLYSQKELHGKNTAQLHEMIHEKGHNWAKLHEHLKNGYVAVSGFSDAAPKWTFQSLSETSGLIPGSNAKMF